MSAAHKLGTAYLAVAVVLGGVAVDVALAAGQTPQQIITACVVVTAAAAGLVVAACMLMALDTSDAKTCDERRALLLRGALGAAAMVVMATLLAFALCALWFVVVVGLTIWRLL